MAIFFYAAADAEGRHAYAMMRAVDATPAPHARLLRVATQREAPERRVTFSPPMLLAAIFRFAATPFYAMPP